VKSKLIIGMVALSLAATALAAANLIPGRPYPAVQANGGQKPEPKGR
jgi:hypothetical protein